MQVFTNFDVVQSLKKMLKNMRETLQEIDL